MNEIKNPEDLQKLSTAPEEKLITSESCEQLLLDHPSYKKLEDQLTDLEQRVNDYWNRTLRLQAELENTQRRAEKDLINAHKYGIEKFAVELLVIVDNLERSLQTKNSTTKELKDLYTGVELTLKLFVETLQKFGVKPINPKGEMFNPDQHTAISIKEEAATPTNTILEVIQKGYWLNERLLRPAMVIVAK